MLFWFYRGQRILWQDLYDFNFLMCPNSSSADRLGWSMIWYWVYWLSIKMGWVSETPASKDALLSSDTGVEWCPSQSRVRKLETSFTKGAHISKISWSSLVANCQGQSKMPQRKAQVRSTCDTFEDMYNGQHQVTEVSNKQNSTAHQASKISSFKLQGHNVEAT